ncbi:MAG TPA: ferrous iron transporter B, partial [Vicinamibacteria bacterium]|nr:ferrous iron transporter B [Vicinamibacteria bacterium]
LGVPIVALVGNPNTGKTTLFNRLTGLRAKTANFPGTTLERRVGSLILGGRRVEVEDLPGLYGLSAGNAEEGVARDALLGNAGRPRPAAALVVVDQTNLARNLYLVSQVRELGLPMLVALNMSDIAGAEGLRVETGTLAREIGAPVVAVSARTGDGLETLRSTLEDVLHVGVAAEPPPSASACVGCTGCRRSSERFDWAEDVAARASTGAARTSSQRTARIDRVLTHSLTGPLVFALVMAALFVALFGLAEWPMNGIEWAVAGLGERVATWLPAGDANSFLVDGVIAGVGGVLVFLPQICLLFFLLSLLEDSGYLARAAFVMDRLMGKVGLPGKAFVPMLSAHACAVPALMSARVIEDRRDRLVTILVLPLLTCSARLPVYAMVTALLFAGQPLLGGLVFAGAYALGIVAALATAWLFKRTVLRGESRPLLLELPTYKVPSLRSAALAATDRGGLFLRKAGSVILLLSIGMWALSTYPKLPDERVAGLSAEAAQAQRLENALAGRVGKAIEPVFLPLGFDWRIDIGELSSFAARETLVSTLSVVFAVGDDEPGSASLREGLRAQVRPDGRPLFGVATACSLLVFFALAMQCLATLAVTRRETGSWRIAGLQFAYMTALAYGAALVTYQALSRLLG